MSALDPSGLAQPGVDESYKTAGNPVDQEPAEKAEAQEKSTTNSGSITDRRGPGDQAVPSQHSNEATPTAMAYGARDSSKDKGEKVRVALLGNM